MNTEIYEAWKESMRDLATEINQDGLFRRSRESFDAALNRLIAARNAAAKTDERFRWTRELTRPSNSTKPEGGN